MSEVLGIWVDAVVRGLVASSLTAALLAPLAWLVLWAARLCAPVYRHAVWLHCLIGIVVLPGLWLYGPKLSLPVLPAHQPVAAAPALPMASVDAVSPLPAQPVTAGQPASARSPGSADHRSSPPPAPARASGLSWKTALVGAWLAGWALMLLRLAVGGWRLQRICRAATPVALAMKRRGVAIRLTDQVEGPVCCGLRRPVILLPRQVYWNSSPDALRMILTHELAHLERRDGWALLFQRLLEAALFFHPGVWFASRQLTHERERICDNWVLVRGASVDDYLALLAAMAERMLGKTSPWPSVALFEGGLRSRVHSLLDPRCRGSASMTRRGAWLCTAGFLLGFAVLGTIRVEARPGARGAAERDSAGGSAVVRGRREIPHTAYALPLAGIAIDGRLDDWPEGLTRYPIAWISPAYQPTPPDGPEDFSAHFRVGYDAAAGLLYLAVEVEDDDLVARPEDPSAANQDLCEVYVDVQRGRYVPEDIQDTRVQQYVMAATDIPLNAWGWGYPREMKGNPAAVSDDPRAGGVRAVFGRRGTTTVYEWAIPLFAHGADESFQIRAGERLGFDVAVHDADGEEEAGNWVAWSPGAAKVLPHSRLGSLVLVEREADLGILAGQVTDGQTPHPGLVLEVFQDTLARSVVRTDAEGRYRLRVLPGQYAVQARGQGIQPVRRQDLTVRAGRQTRADLVVEPLAVPQILRRSVARYAALHSYSDTTFIERRTIQPGVDKRWTTALALTFARPDRFRLENHQEPGEATSVRVGDGERMTLFHGRLNLYLQRPAPDRLRLAASPLLWEGGVELLVLQLLSSDAPYEELMRGAEEVRVLGSETLNGVPAAVLELILPASAVAGDLALPGPLKDMTTPIPVRVWIGKQDYLIHQLAFALEMRELADGLLDPWPAEIRQMRVEYTLRHRAIQLDPPLADTFFVFTPPPDARLVSQ